MSGGTAVAAKATLRRAAVVVTGIVVSGLAALSVVALPAPARAEPAGGWLVTLRPAAAFPGGVALAWQAGSGRWWAAGMEFDKEGVRPQNLWTGPQWPLGPDTLSRFSVRVGYELGSSGGSGGPSGLWIGLWAGQQWAKRPFMVQFGTEIRVPAGAWHSPAWVTSAAVGLAW